MKSNEESSLLHCGLVDYDGYLQLGERSLRCASRVK